MKRCFALLPFLVLPAHAQDVSEVPTALFGVGLGSVYEYGPDSADDNAVGTFPVKRLVSEQRSVHKGLSLYFEPLTENPAFPFREILQEDGANRITSYRLHVFPVIPSGTTTLAELQESNLPQQVNMIEWGLGGPEPRNGDDYMWARNLCRSTEVDLGTKPEITDSADSGVYRCIFASGDRELEISSVIGRTVQLSFVAAVSDQMDAEVNTRLRRLELEELRRKRPRPQ
jgi:hypothetical protein